MSHLHGYTAGTISCASYGSAMLTVACSYSANRQKTCLSSHIRSSHSPWSGRPWEGQWTSHPHGGWTPHTFSSADGPHLSWSPQSAPSHGVCSAVQGGQSNLMDFLSFHIGDIMIPLIILFPLLLQKRVIINFERSLRANTSICSIFCTPRVKQPA